MGALKGKVYWAESYPAYIGLLEEPVHKRLASYGWVGNFHVNKNPNSFSPILIRSLPLVSFLPFCRGETSSFSDSLWLGALQSQPLEDRRYLPYHQSFFFAIFFSGRIEDKDLSMFYQMKHLCSILLLEKFVGTIL